MRTMASQSCCPCIKGGGNLNALIGKRGVDDHDPVTDSRLAPGIAQGRVDSNANADVSVK